ncbi:hypothetical protein FB45DRAFT_1052759 [Roridomyces roridus]|uniref:Uncharacterized protein n=1 Tax=Roridomyces roridus TaxID=1738132 RepID=A0AAD7CCT7_9AGAR|nr:hypothetical protein FB45DRAFT_1052759 [Roridomyces roridus]
MPFSISALFALPRAFVGLLVTRQAAYLAAPAAPKYTPTRTTEIYLEPTRCIPSPTPSTPIEFPYHLLIGLAALSIVTCFAILQTSAPAPASAPPVPRSRPEKSLPPPSPPRTPFTTLLRLYAFGILAYLIMRDYEWPTFTTPDVVPVIDTGLQQLESTFTYGLAAAMSLSRHIQDHGYHHLKTLLLAVIGHCLGLLVVVAHRRLRDLLYRRRRSVFSAVQRWWPLPAMFSLPTTLFTFHPQFNWIPWMIYYFACRDGSIPSLQQVRRSVVLSVPSIPIPSICMILGPSTLYFIIASLWTLSLLLVRLPTVIRPAISEVKQSGSMHFLLVYNLTMTAFLYALSVAIFTKGELGLMGHEVRTWISDLEGRAFFSSDARSQVWEFYRLSRERHSSWRIVQTRQLYKIIRLMWTTSWESLHWGHKLLIVVPVVAFYTYLCIGATVDTQSPIEDTVLVSSRPSTSMVKNTIRLYSTTSMKMIGKRRIPDD